MQRKKKFPLEIADYKILETIFLLNKDFLFPNNEGIFEILTGKDTIDVIAYNEFPTYGSIKSYSNKRISRMIGVLKKHRYIVDKYDPNTKEYYLAITNIGVRELEEYKKNKKTPFSVKKAIKKPLVVKID